MRASCVANTCTASMPWAQSAGISPTEAWLLHQHACCWRCAGGAALTFMCCSHTRFFWQYLFSSCEVQPSTCWRIMKPHTHAKTAAPAASVEAALEDGVARRHCCRQSSGSLHSVWLPPASSKTLQWELVQYLDISRK